MNTYVGTIGGRKICLNQIFDGFLIDFSFPAYRKCQSDDFHCGPDGLTERRVTDPCIPKEKHCDGYYDCRNLRDEQGCPGVACRLDQFRCANGQRCVELSAKCDHKNDCVDKSDEQNCSKYFYCDY